MLCIFHYQKKWISPPPWPNSISWSSHLAPRNLCNSSSGSRSCAPRPLLEPQRWNGERWAQKTARCPFGEVSWGLRVGAGKGTSDRFLPGPSTSQGLRWRRKNSGYRRACPPPPRGAQAGAWVHLAAFFLANCFESFALLNRPLARYAPDWVAIRLGTWKSSLATESLSAQKARL